MVHFPGYSIGMLGRDPAKVAFAWLAEGATRSKIDHESVKIKDHRAVVDADAADPVHTLGFFRAKKAQLKRFPGLLAESQGQNLSLARIWLPRRRWCR